MGHLFLKGDKLQKFKIRAKVLLGLYGGFGTLLLVLYRVAEYHIRKSAGMPVLYEFSVTENIVLGIIGIIIGLSIYKITDYFERGPGRYGKNAISCGVINFIIFFSVLSVFLLLTGGATPGGVIIPFAFGGILGVSSFFHIQFKVPLGEIEALKLEHGELGLIVRLLTETTVIFITGAIIVSAFFMWRGYFPDYTTYVIQIFALYAVLTLYGVAGVFGIIAQIFRRMKKIRTKLDRSRKGYRTRARG